MRGRGGKGQTVPIAGSLAAPSRPPSAWVAAGARARAQLAELLERPVHLFLNVKERAGWDEEGARLRAIGLDDSSTR